MNLYEETVALRRKFAMLACEADMPCLSRYCLLPKGSVYRILHKLAGLLRGWGVSIQYVQRHEWNATLKHGEWSIKDTPLLIWALGDAPKCYAGQIQVICERVSRLLRSTSNYVPVLVTDVADFRYYSRLGWLVEYVPDLSCREGNYRESKLRYLAWRYRGATIIPANAAYLTESDWHGLLSR